jgi:hypothetical protein
VRRLLTPVAALVAAAAPTVALTLLDPQPGVVAVVAAVGIATGGIVALRELEHRGRRVDVRAVGLAGVVVAVASVLVPPRNSSDLWSYVMYGRIFAIHHASPWVALPASFPHDPFLYRVSAGWRHTTSIYGPGFEAVAAIVARVAGSSATVARVLMKSVFAVATLAAGWLVARRTRSAAATAVVLLHPVVALSGIVGGHNDILVGLAVLAAVLLATDDRPVAAGVVLALGATVKLTGAIAVLAIGAWAWHRYGHRWALRFGAIACGGILLLYAPFGTSGLSAVGKNKSLLSRASVWQLPRLFTGLDSAHAVVHLGLPGHWNTSLVTLGTMLTGLLVIATALRFARLATPQPGVVAALAAFLLFAPYVLPWYSVWMVPALALDIRSPVARLLVWQAAMITLIYELKFQGVPEPASGIIWWTGIILSVAFALAFLVRARAATRARAVAPGLTGPSRPGG